MVICAQCEVMSRDRVAGPGGGLPEGWSRFEVSHEDGDTVYYSMLCAECVAEAEDAGWPVASAQR